MINYNPKHTVPILKERGFKRSKYFTENRKPIYYKSTNYYYVNSNFKHNINLKLKGKKLTVSNWGEHTEKVLDFYKGDFKKRYGTWNYRHLMTSTGGFRFYMNVKNGEMLFQDIFLQSRMKNSLYDDYIEITLFEDLFQCCVADPIFLAVFQVNIGIICQHIHIKSRSSLCNLSADSPQSNNA